MHELDGLWCNCVRKGADIFEIQLPVNVMVLPPLAKIVYVHTDGLMFLNRSYIFKRLLLHYDATVFL